MSRARTKFAIHKINAKHLMHCLNSEDLKVSRDSSETL